MAWIWRLALIALITWIAVPLLQHTEPENTEPTSEGQVMVDSALTVWQRFWAERTPTPTNAASLEATVPRITSLVDQPAHQPFLDTLLRSEQVRTLGREQIQQQAASFGITLTAEDADAVLVWLSQER